MKPHLVITLICIFPVLSFSQFRTDIPGLKSLILTQENWDSNGLRARSVYVADYSEDGLMMNGKNVHRWQIKPDSSVSISECSYDEKGNILNFRTEYKDMQHTTVTLKNIPTMKTETKLRRSTAMPWTTA